MIGFLNERSLDDHVNLVDSLRLFLEAARELAPMNVTLRKDSAFFFDGNFKARFGVLGINGDIRPLIRQLVFSERYYQDWRPTRVSIDDVYVCDAPRFELLDESLCEITEIKLRNPALDTAVFSAVDSEFGQTEELVISNSASDQRTSLRNITSLDLVRQWLTQQRGYYDPDSRGSPKDFQTILEKEPQRFRPTTRIERRGNRRVFEEDGTRRLYFVCAMHAGRSAHLEVFDGNCEHVGKADINSGNLISPKIDGRKLRY